MHTQSKLAEFLHVNLEGTDLVVHLHRSYSGPDTLSGMQKGKPDDHYFLEIWDSGLPWLQWFLCSRKAVGEVFENTIILYNLKYCDQLKGAVEKYNNEFGARIIIQGNDNVT